MKLHISTNEGRNAITGYGPGFVDVNARRYTSNLVVQPDCIETGWSTAADGSFDQDSVAFLAKLGAEIVLLGTGAVQRFPEPLTLRPLVDAGIGFEVMNTRAACRTYNILVAENRRVVAALLV